MGAARALAHKTYWVETRDCQLDERFPRNHWSRERVTKKQRINELSRTCRSFWDTQPFYFVGLNSLLYPALALDSLLPITHPGC